MAKPTKTHATLIDWDEIGETAPTRYEHEGKQIKLTRGDDKKLAAELRKLNGDEKECGEWGWELIGIVHLPKTTTVEWRGSRGHHAVTVVCWMP